MTQFAIRQWIIMDGEVEDPENISVLLDGITEYEMEKFLSERTVRIGPRNALDRIDGGEVFYEGYKPYS